MEEARRRVAILLAASILVAPRLREMRDTPALRAAVAEAIRVAEYILRVIESKY